MSHGACPRSPPGDAAGTLLLDGTVLIAGGGGLFYDQDSRAEVYDPKSGTVFSVPNMPIGRKGFTLTTLWDGTALAAGGVYYDDGEFAFATRQTDLYNSVLK
jgi:hypothetical protein